jgi:hypothetical protein
MVPAAFVFHPIRQLQKIIMFLRFFSVLTSSKGCRSQYETNALVGIVRPNKL